MMPAGRRMSRLRLLPRYLRRPRIDPMRMMSSNRSVMAFNLIWLWDRVDRLDALYEPMAAVLRDPPLVGRVFPFGEAPEALRWMKTGESVGKIVLEVT
jgi:alcohol dehydrogenase